MRFAISYSTPQFVADPGRLIDYARHAEECGFEALYLPEHIATQPGARLGAMEFPADLPIADPLDCLAFVAAATTRLLLGTAVLLAPYHHPVILAKRLATIDVLSGGRMRLLTVGVGALPHEAMAAGVDFRTRGRRADEVIDVLRLLWTGGPVSYHGEFYDFTDLCSYPRPLADLPIHIGGSSLAAARRAAARGDGWFPGGMLAPGERARQLEVARSSGRALDYTRWGSIDLLPEQVSRYAEQGVTRLVVSPTAGDPSAQRAQMTAFATRHALTHRH
ncbi:TIGR03619 family F420-dependent LLM class oxidoreductase [Actinoplanes sp. CA-142083]|uniref:TIGR03619 family F420-dependent LLM class oxidoreductase n=1 Tax=Actinoplanes sp. CA-142083 TaxID=3239903 RepID=UPI003D8BDC28